ncbi:MAG: hypothetical protein KKH22_04060 [Proteobacteria bacterium]|nr:hypothetical protein [Pseudomonadota bacterium]
MALNDTAQTILALLQSGAMVVIAGLIWKAMQQQVKAAHAAEDVKTQTLAALEKSHAGEIAQLQALVATLKEQLDFSSKVAPEIMQKNVELLQQELEKSKKEAQQLMAKLEELQNKNQNQALENKRLIDELERLKLHADTANLFVFDDVVSGLKHNNNILSNTNELLKGLKPRVVGSDTQLFTLPHTSGVLPERNLFPTQANSLVFLDIDPSILKVSDE